MTTDAYDDEYTGPLRWNGYKTAAALFQVLSWLTTYWLVSFILDPQTPGQSFAAYAISIAAEYGLVKMKSLVFDGDHKTDGAGWAGFILDGIINAGGILPKASKVLLWPPLMTLMVRAELAPKDENIQFWGGIAVAVIAGLLLSVLPHRLWRRGNLD